MIIRVQQVGDRYRLQIRFLFFFWSNTSRILYHDKEAAIQVAQGMMAESKPITVWPETTHSAKEDGA